MNSPVIIKRSDIGLNSQIPSKIQKTNNDCGGIVPMDIDCNNSNAEEYPGSIEKMDVDMNYPNYIMESLNNLDAILKKRKLRPESDFSETDYLMNNTQVNPILCEKKESRCGSISLIIVIFLLLLLYFSYCFFPTAILYVNSDIQLQNLRKDLLEEVYGQKGPVNIIIQSLEHRNHWAKKIKVVGFIGSVGVGKTFITNILKKHFHSELVHEMCGNQFNFKSQWEKILSRLKSCCLNLIIIDDLDKRDVITLFEFVHSLPENHYILIVSVFSIQSSDDKLNYIINYDDINEIRHEFDNSNLFYELAVFNQFNVNHIKDWLEIQLKVQNIDYSEKLLNNVLHNHNASYEGLKGLHAKILLELEGKD